MHKLKALPLVLTFLALLMSACRSNTTREDLNTTCTEPRPQICTMDYQPVCGITKDGLKKTYSNGCSACSDHDVIGYNQGACPEL